MSPSAHNDAFELVPWLANGTLRSPEREAVEQHVKTCIVCRRELEAQQQLNAAVRRQPTLHVSAQAGYELLHQRLSDTETARKTPLSWRRRYGALRPFAVALAAGIAFLAVLLWFTPLPNAGTGMFQTLATAPTGDGVLVDIIFTQQTTAAQMQQLLDAIDGEIVAGPTDVGRYSVRIAGRPANDNEITGLVTTLAADPRVRFAARSHTEPQ